jgi:RimJ/RimL family protein N-acetyltransferase
MESKNLLIRPTQFQDCLLFSQWETQISVTEYFSIDEDRDYEQIVREYVIGEEDPSKLQFTILRKDYEGEDQIIGRVLITRIDRNSDSLDITRIYIGPEELRNQGYGEEAMRLILEHCFIHLHTERVTLDHFTGNDPASRLYMKLGFVYEGIARNGAKKNGRFYDLNIMSLLRSEYYEKVHNK